MLWCVAIRSPNWSTDAGVRRHRRLCCGRASPASGLTRAGYARKVPGAWRGSAPFGHIDRMACRSRRGRRLDEAIRDRLAHAARRQRPPASDRGNATRSDAPAALRVGWPERHRRPPTIRACRSRPTCCGCCTGARRRATRTRQALDAYFAAMAESGMGPATFTARTVASTQASLAAAMPSRRGVPLPVRCMAARLARRSTCWTPQRPPPISMRGSRASSRRATVSLASVIACFAATIRAPWRCAGRCNA